MTIACETLAENFDLRKGWVEITVPRVDPAKDYTITRAFFSLPLLPAIERLCQFSATRATSARSSPSSSAAGTLGNGSTELQSIPLHWRDMGT